MSLAYTFKESVSGFKRAKLATFVSVVTVSISLLLLGVFAVLTINVSRLLETLRGKVEMEAFLQEPVTPADVEELAKKILAVEGVESALFVSKDEAARIFKEEFGEDINSVLDFNPLPPSFKIALKEGYKTSAGAQKVYDGVVQVKGIEKVIYRKALLELIDRRTSTIHDLTLGLGLLISLSSIFLVANTIRLAIHSKRKLLRTMELVGATRPFIRLPFLLEGAIQGFVGGLVATALLFVLLQYGVRFLSSEFIEFSRMPWTFYGLVLLTGMALGLTGSIISVVRFIRLQESP